MMLREDKGQVSVEFMLIFAISLIILIVFTLPLADSAIGNTLDVANTLKVKSDMYEISSAVSQVYAEGQGSKRSVIIFSDSNIRITADKKCLSADLRLNDDSHKLIKSGHNSNLGNSLINIKKGKNIVVVEWPAGNEKMSISS